jgi:methyltransferase (TIGR00027 family)
MEPGRASRTAEHNALFRALESGRRPGERVVDDPLARAFLDRRLRAVAWLGSRPGGRTAVPRLIDRRWPGVRSAVVARTRYIDGAVRAAVAGGVVGQVVVLGAGFDTRAHRLTELAEVPVFEVDHPATQEAKRRALARARVAAPGTVAYVPCDFATTALAEAMAAAGYRPEVPALIVWEGVTNYLDEPAVDATLRWCAGSAPRSVLIVTYVDRQVIVHPERYAGSDRLRATLARVGERFTFGLDPAEVPDRLADLGLRLSSDVAAPEFRRLAYGPAADRIVGHEFYRVAVAER